MTSSPVSQKSPSSQLTPDEQVSALVRIGVPREKAERTVRGEQRETVGYVAVVGPPLPLPIRVVLPWSVLISDNDKYGAAIINTSGKHVPKLLLTGRYRAAKETARKLARAAMTVDGYLFTPLRNALQLNAKVWVPNNRPHDVANFAKLVCDALEKAVYVNDSQLHRVTWERAGVDVDRPRAELTIGPIGGWQEL